MSNTTTPNLFIVGAPKCGTTTLHHWLSLHPDVYMSSHKEPAFFCDFSSKKWEGPDANIFIDEVVGDKDTYEALFEGTQNYKWRGESSTDYLWVDVVPRQIVKQYGREGKKFLVVLRNPTERAFSEHSHLVRDELEDLDFISAIKKEAERFEKNWQPLFYHVKHSLYSAPLERYFSIFGRNHVKVILFDDLKENPKQVFREICIFLDIRKITLPINRILNKSGRPRSQTIHKLIKKIQQ